MDLAFFLVLVRSNDYFSHILKTLAHKFNGTDQQKPVSMLYDALRGRDNHALVLNF